MTQPVQKIIAAKPHHEALSAYPEPTRAQAEEAVRTLLAWTGDHPLREGLLETPALVVRDYEEFFSGYTQDPDDVSFTELFVKV